MLLSVSHCGVAPWPSLSPLPLDAIARTHDARSFGRARLAGDAGHAWDVLHALRARAHRQGRWVRPRGPPQPVERSDRRPARCPRVPIDGQGSSGGYDALLSTVQRKPKQDAGAIVKLEHPVGRPPPPMPRRDCTHRPVAFRAARSAERRVSNAQRRVQPADPHARQLGAQHVQIQHTHVQLERAMQRIACVRARACGESTGGACLRARACVLACVWEERARIWPNRIRDLRRATWPHPARSTRHTRVGAPRHACDSARSIAGRAMPRDMSFVVRRVPCRTFACHPYGVMLHAMVNTYKAHRYTWRANPPHGVCSLQTHHQVVRHKHCTLCTQLACARARAQVTRTASTFACARTSTC